MSTYSNGTGRRSVRKLLLSLRRKIVRVQTRVWEGRFGNGKEDKFMRYSEGIIITIL